MTDHSTRRAWIFFVLATLLYGLGFWLTSQQAGRLDDLTSRTAREAKITCVRQNEIIQTIDKLRPVIDAARAQARSQVLLRSEDAFLKQTQLLGERRNCKPKAFDAFDG